MIRTKNNFCWDIKYPKFIAHKRGGKQIQRYRAFFNKHDSNRLVRAQTFRRYYEYPRMPKIKYLKRKDGFFCKKKYHG